MESFEIGKETQTCRDPRGLEYMSDFSGEPHALLGYYIWHKDRLQLEDDSHLASICADMQTLFGNLHNIQGHGIRQDLVFGKRPVWSATREIR